MCRTAQLYRINYEVFKNIYIYIVGYMYFDKY